MGDPKSKRSSRQVALSVATKQLLQDWIQQPKLSQGDDWLFPSENGKPISRDNVWRRHMLPKLEPIGLGWATFQVMRRNFRHAVERSGSGCPYPVSADGQHG